MKAPEIFSNLILNNIKKYSIFLIYILVNSLFVVKYGEKYGHVLYLFFHNVNSFDLFLKHNPFMIQGAKQPLLLSISYIVLAFILSFKLRSFYDIVYWVGILLFICVFVPFILYLGEYGYENIITNSQFDISFFNMSMPLVMISVVLVFFENTHKKELL